MNFELTEEQEMIRAAAREFAQNEIAPIAADVRCQRRIPDEDDQPGR